MSNLANAHADYVENQQRQHNHQNGRFTQETHHETLNGA